jgi:hypothetical protein
MIKKWLDLITQIHFHMKRSLLLFSALGCIVFIRGQSLTPVVIATCGGYSVGSATSISYTAGETITPTFSNGVHILTQGFQQPDRDLTISIEENPSWSAQAFPNPTESILNVHIQNCQNQTFDWQIIDIKGATIQFNPNPVEVNGELTFQISVEELVPATYVLMLTQPGSKPYVIKFIKN